ncbi:MAG: cell division protein ZapE [Oxalobacteraceae bacterium]
MNVQEFYEKTLVERGYQSDPAQLAAVDRLQRAFDDWGAYMSRRSSRLRRMIIHPDPPRGVYLWGGVGRGKSFLMDSFYAVIPVRRKTRVHFHEFMREVHRALDEEKNVENPLDQVARKIARRYRLICFDEFHVSDIADAMILYNLLKALFEQGVSFVMTSNYPPDGLYPDGLHRDRMLPAIDLLKEKLDVLAVDAGTDYRRRVMEKVEAYQMPLGPVAESALLHAFVSIAEAGEQDPRITIESREIRCVRRAGGVIWFDFATLCGGPRSQNDYLDIANRFHTVILSEVPRMTAEMASAARRFTWLIDVLYDHRVKLIISAAVAPELLYTEGVMSNEFHRTVSRITEMQSREYKESSRRQAAGSIT